MMKLKTIAWLALSISTVWAGLSSPASAQAQSQPAPKPATIAQPTTGNDIVETARKAGTYELSPKLGDGRAGQAAAVAG